MLDVRGIQNCEFIENCSEDKWIGPLVGGRPTTHQATRAGTEGQIYSTTHFWTFAKFLYIHTCVVCIMYLFWKHILKVSKILLKICSVALRYLCLIHLV